MVAPWESICRHCGRSVARSWPLDATRVCCAGVGADDCQPLLPGLIEMEARGDQAQREGHPGRAWVDSDGGAPPAAIRPPDAIRSWTSRCRAKVLALLFSTHDLAVVRSLCDRVVVLYLGRVMESGPVAQVLEAPRHPYTQALLSAAPSLEASRRRTRILLQGDPPSPSAPPSGCVFRMRCPVAMPACAETVPALVDGVACLRVG
ncbi:MAG: ABC transporter ATP-binding protein [Rhodospirillales bacterium]|nr:ABC transporter ATP-binding protein [Rhodospirillales bacterium]